MTSSDLILGKFTLDSTITFQVYPASIYGDIFRNATPTDLVSANTASRWGIDPEAEHAKVYPLLPSGTVPDDARAYKWLVLKLEDDTERVIGLPWIKVDSIVVVDTVNAKVTVPAIGSGDVEKIRLALSSAGFNNFTITTE